MKKRSRIYVIKLNRKMLLALIVLLIIIIVLLKSSNSFEIFKHRAGPIVVIDPGHGGIDGGTSDAEGLLEKDINLDVGLYLRDELKKDGFNVIMTRDKDESLEDFSNVNASRYRRDLNARKTIINKNKPVAFVSIHVNSSEVASAKGVQVYYYPDSSESKKMAESICEEIEPDAKAVSQDYFILRETEYTGVLVEIGFISNPEDNVLLKDKKYKKKIAYSIKEGIKEYLKTL